jgi:hypothetical protein
LNSQRTTAAIAPASLGPLLPPFNIGYQQDSLFDAACPFRVPHDRRHLFILHSGVQQVIEVPASEELHFSAAKEPEDVRGNRGPFAPSDYDRGD